MLEDTFQDQACPETASEPSEDLTAASGLSPTVATMAKQSSPPQDQESTPIPIRRIRDVESSQGSAIEITASADSSHTEQNTSLTRTIPHMQSSSQKNTKSISVTIYGRGSTGRIKAREQRIAKREARLEKILFFLKNHATIRNEQVVKLLRVSDATASRYAGILIARGSIVRQGRGRGAQYALAIHV